MGDISELPKSIIHHILSYLKTEEAARISVFCKAWYRAWLNCSTLRFDATGYDPKRRKKLHKFIKITLQRYQEQKIHIEQLTIKGSSSITQVVEWIKIAVRNGVKILDLEFSIDSKGTLPSTVCNAKSLIELRVLSLGTLEFGKLMKNKVVMFPNLRKLYLSAIIIDEVTFQGILKRCPLIEKLSVSSINELKKIKVTGLYNLKELSLGITRSWRHAVEIEAPNLEYLDLIFINGPVGSFKLNKTKNLKYLAIDGHLPTQTFLDNFGHKFPLVENFRLRPPAYINDWGKINISSHALKHIMIDSLKRFRELSIDAPNMVSLELQWIQYFPDLCLTNAPVQWKLKFSITNNCRLNTEEFCKLKLFLSKSIRSKISISLSWFRPLSEVDVTEIPVSPAVEVEDIWLNFEGIPRDASFLDALFMTCHPKVILTYHDAYNVVGFLYENLVEKKYEGKSWYPELKEVKLEIEGASKKWQPIDWNSLPEVPKKLWGKICFRLEWDSGRV